MDGRQITKTRNDGTEKVFLGGKASDMYLVVPIMNLTQDNKYSF